MYKTIDGDVNGTQVFLVTEGEFKGVTFYFGSISMVPPEGGWDESGEPDHVTFSFEVTGGPDHLDKEGVEGSEAFQTLAGDILFDFIGKAFAEGKYELGKINNEKQEINVHGES